LADQARKDVVAAARPEADDDADRLGRVAPRRSLCASAGMPAAPIVAAAASRSTSRRVDPRVFGMPVSQAL
jgi:hypothetical protein